MIFGTVGRFGPSSFSEYESELQHRARQAAAAQDYIGRLGRIAEFTGQQTGLAYAGLGKRARKRGSTSDEQRRMETATRNSENYKRWLARIHRDPLADAEPKA